MVAIFHYLLWSVALAFSVPYNVAAAEQDDRNLGAELIGAIAAYEQLKAKAFANEEDFQQTLREFARSGAVPAGMSEREMQDFFATEIIICDINSCPQFETMVAAAMALNLDLFRKSMLPVAPALWAWGKDGCSGAHILATHGVFSTVTETMQEQQLSAFRQGVSERLCK